MNSGLTLKNVCKNSLNRESAIESHLQPQSHMKILNGVRKQNIVVGLI